MSLALALSVTGCGGGLPRSGPVVSGSRIVDDPRIGLLQVIPNGPGQGVAPVDVVRGFLLAGSSAADDHAVARMFLTRAAAQVWRPNTVTTLVRTTPDLVPVALPTSGAPTAGTTASEATGASEPPADGDQTQVRLDAGVLAVVDATGHYVQQPRGTSLTRSVRLVREDGEWRIADPGNGVVLTQLDASRTLRPFSVYFATPDGARLVGDVRWFGYDSSTATRIVTELLVGPSDWLAPAVTSGAPVGTRLRVGTVPVAGGVATVDLSDQALAGSPDERGLLLAQLKASLTRLPGVSGVRVTVDGADLSRDASPGPGEPPLPVQAAADPRLVLLGPTGLARYDGFAAQAVAGTGPELALGGTASHPAVSDDGTAYAVLTDGARTVRVQRPGGRSEVALTDPVALVPPSIDREGWVWSVSTTSGADPLVVPADAVETPPAQVALPADGLSGSVLRLRVSRDGARLLVVTVDAAGITHVRVHGIVRGVGGKPLRLTAGSPELVPGDGQVLDASWLRGDQIVVLERPAGDGDPVPVVSALSGPAQQLPAVAGAESIAAGWNERGIVVGTGAGRLLTRSGADWLAVADGRDPAYPG
ncbi:MAG: LpqB family beta-propeller domain-containing protein [Janthinobacterium lividum]